MRTAPLAILTAVAGIAPIAGCFGATEIRVAITTTVECSAGIQTQLFTGPRGTTDFGIASVAETSECLPEEPRIGTLSIVPSGSRDDQFEVQVVAGVGVPASDCRAEALGQVDPNKVDPTKGCIVARRRVSFRPHDSLDLPVLLSARCINVPCGGGQTCDLGTCTPTAGCNESGCPRERAEVPVDAGPDVLVDAAPDLADASDDAPSVSPSPPTLVVDGQKIVGQLQIDGTDFLYVNAPNPFGTVEVKRIARDGSTASVYQSNSQITATVAGPAGIAWASDATTRMVITRTLPPGMMFTTLASDLHGAQALAFSGNTIVGFANNPNTGALLAFGGVSGVVSMEAPNPVLSGGVPEILVDDEGHWYGVSGQNVVHYNLTAGASTPVFVGALQNAGAMADFALVGHTLYLGLGLPSLAGIHRIVRESLNTATYQLAPWIPTAVPRSIASYGTSLYYVEGTTLFRADTTASAGNPTALGSVAADADRLAVDDAYVYWVEVSGSRIMRRAR